MYIACAAGHLAGARLVEEQPKPASPPQPDPNYDPEFTARWMEMFQRASHPRW